MPGAGGDGGDVAGRPGTSEPTDDMRDIPSTQIVEEMLVGWNLGNTLDADPNETAWGNPQTTQGMIDAVRAAGFNTLRVPVTWMHHMDGPPGYTVDEQWLDRVEEVTNYVLSTGMYAIVNTHHEEWVSLMPNADHDEITRQIEQLWTQIATRFRDYGDRFQVSPSNMRPEARALLTSLAP
jgi:endoglucanase